MRLSCLSLLCVIFFLCFSSLCVHGVQQVDDLDAVPNFISARVLVEENGARVVQQLINKALFARLSNLSLPDQTVKLPIGHIELSQLSIPSITFGQQDISYIAPNQVSVTLSQLQGELDDHWRYKAAILSVSGTAQNILKSAAISFTIQIGNDLQGHPTLTMTTLKIDIQDLELKFHGGGSKLWSWLINLLKPIFIKMIEKKLDTSVRNELNAILSTLPQRFPIQAPLKGWFNGSELYFGLMQSPDAFSIQSDATGLYLDLAIAGTIFPIHNTSAIYPAQPTPVPSPAQLPPSPYGTLPQFAIAVDDYLINSAFYTQMLDGKLNFIINDSMLPPKIPFRLNTGSIAHLWPDLAQAYPNTELQLVLDPYVQTSPSIQFYNDSFAVFSPFQVILQVLPATEDTPIDVASFLFNSTLPGSLQINMNAGGSLVISGKLSSDPISLQTLWTAFPNGVGLFTFALNGFMDVFVDVVTVPIINAALGLGVTLPLNFPPGLALAKPFLASNEHTLVIGMDLVLSEE